MGCPKVVEESHGSSPSPSLSSALNEALLLATMRIIGLPVYVHVKDGSVYSGIFYTASVENDFRIVLKNAKLTKKGTSKANVPSGTVVETLVIRSSDIVQVIAKGVSLPSNLAVDTEGENVESAMATVPSEPSASKAKESTKIGMEGRHVNHKRNLVRNGTHFVDEVRTIKSGKDQDGRNPLSHCVQNAIEAEHGRRDGIEVMKNEDHHSFLMDERQAGAHILGHDERTPNVHGEDNIDVQSSSSSSGSNSERLRPIKEDKMTSKPLTNGLFYDAAERPLSTDNPSFQSTNADEISESCRDPLASPKGLISPKVTETAKRTKEFKLNPGAKIFSPSLTKLVSPTPAGMLTAGNMAYIPSNIPMVQNPDAVQQEAGIISPFIAHASPPSKFAQHSNLTAGNGVTGSQFSQPITGATGNRAQPLRYASQYHPAQAAPMLVNPNPQVMVGRLGQLVYVQPVSQDMVQGTPALAPLPSRPLLANQQAQYPKHQGVTVGGQPYQLCVPQPLVASGQQPYAVPAHIPVLQPPHPGPHGFFGPKFP